MSEARETDESVAPPGKPRGARRWPWAVVVLLVVAYVGCYMWRRAQPYNIHGLWADNGTWQVIVFRDTADPWPPFESPGLFLRPCIAVEEWWMNR